MSLSEKAKSMQTYRGPKKLCFALDDARETVLRVKKRLCECGRVNDKVCLNCRILDEEFGGKLI